MIKAIIDGNIGVGKSFFITQLQEKYKLIPLLENFEDNYALKKMFSLSNNHCCLNTKGNYCNVCGEGLSEFYRKRQYAFITQLIFLITRTEQFIQEYFSNNICVIERSIFSDKYIFLEELYEQKAINQDEYNMYNRLFDLFLSILEKNNENICNIPLILIDAPLDIMIKRIEKRNRDFEAWYIKTEEGIKYLQELEKKYLNMFNKYKGKKILIKNLDNNLEENLNKILEFLNDKTYKELEYLKKYNVSDFEIKEIYDIIKKRGINFDNTSIIIDIIEFIRNER